MQSVTSSGVEEWQNLVTEASLRLLARDLIPEQIDLHGLVSPNLPHRRHPIADSRYICAAHRVAGFRLLRAGRVACCGGGRHLCATAFSLCRAARIRAC